MYSQWTLGDLAMMTHAQIANQQQEQYGSSDIQLELFCEYCTVVPVAQGDKYCLYCTQVLTDDMALAWQEQQACDNGAY